MNFYMSKPARLILIAAGLAAGSVLSQSAKSQTQPVNFADLEGMEVWATAIHQRVIRRDGRQFPVRQNNDIHLWLKPGNTIEGRIELTTYSPRRVRKGKSPAFTFTLEQPREMKKRFLGEGHAVWFFENETLINLRTYKGGAIKREIAFVRATEGYSCTIRETFVREVGVAAIEMKSAIDGATNHAGQHQAGFIELPGDQVQVSRRLRPLQTLPIQLGSLFENLKEAAGPISPLEASRRSNCLDQLV